MPGNEIYPSGQAKNNKEGDPHSNANRAINHVDAVSTFIAVCYEFIRPLRYNRR